MRSELRSKHWFACFAIFSVLLCALLLPAYVSAQVAGAALSGTVSDKSGAVIPKAQVAIKHSATGITRELPTNADGYYTAPNLQPGTYEVTVSATGFNTEVRPGVLLNVGTEQTLNFSMQVGNVSETVQVNTEAPAIQVTSSDISATVNSTTVRELPLNGRSWTDLATLQPGVDAIHTQPDFAVGADRGNRGFGQQLTISGARPQQNNYRIDGVSVNDYANGGPGSVLGGNMGVDAIQEFSVLTSNYSAEYGKTSGGVVNAITRSGTNGFHGSAYEFLRNSALDARNFFEDPALPKAPFRQNQFGASLGGPILKNRTFFFANYEGLRQTKGIPVLDNVPSNAARMGMIHDSTTGLPITVMVDSNVQKYLPLFPTSTNVIGNGDVAQFTFTAKRAVTENFLTTRIDHKFSDKDSVFGTYIYDKAPYTSPDSFNNSLLTSVTSRQIVAVEETHGFTPSFLNSVRFGYNHQAVNNNQGLSAINPVAGDTSLAAGPNFAGQHASFVSIAGLDPMPGGVGALPTYIYHWNTFAGYDDAFWSRGAHSIKFGVAAERMQLQVIAKSDPAGIWQFNSLQDFLTNNPKRFQGGIPSTVSPRDLRQTLAGLYVQDDWRWKSNVTLNLGLRYEMVTVPTEIHGKLANLRNITDAAPHLGSPFFDNPTLKNFEPRIGFAWDPFRNGKMAVRGGFGLFDVLPLPYQFPLLTTLATPFFGYTVIGRSSFTRPNAFFDGLPATLPANKLRQTFIEPHPKRNYVMQWNLNVQYQLMTNLTAMVAYVGSRGVHQPFRVDDADLVLPRLTSAGYLWPQVDVDGNEITGPNAGNPPSRINENFGSVRGMFYEGRSYYDALELQLSKRMSHGFQVQGVYTWGKSIDTSSATVAGDAFANSIASLHYFDPKLSRALSDFNVARTLVLNGTWELPYAKSVSGPLSFVLNGWQLGLIFTAADGTPFTASWGTGADPLGTLSSDDWDFPQLTGAPGCKTLTNPGNVNNYIKTSCFQVPLAPDAGFFAANCDPAPPSFGGPLPPGDLRCFNLRGNAGRNILISPGVKNLDFSVFKNNYIRKISEKFNVQFRAEVFNILNHPMFASPITPDSTDIFNGDGSLNSNVGRLKKTSIPERQIQFALKIIF
ncbi:MAG: TonB-dependent receptor [Acidipila sp.]|nr:TonB-dependent receptor [Acidipila sp.]